MRLPNDPITVAVVLQVASPRNISDDQHVSLNSLGRSVQQLRDIAAIDDNWFLLSNYLSRAFGSKTATPIPGSSPLVIHTIPCVVFSRGILNVALAASLIGEIDDKKSGGP